MGEEKKRDYLRLVKNEDKRDLTLVKPKGTRNFRNINHFNNYLQKRRRETTNRSLDDDVA